MKNKIKEMIWKSCCVIENFFTKLDFSEQFLVMFPFIVLLLYALSFIG
tara:strand:- start:136052 stop:136195 length:144 start_codon:yes stop_codon:yes gene_type:complete